MSATEPAPSTGTDVDLTTWSGGVFLVSGSVATVATWALDVFVPGQATTKGSTRAFAVKASNARGMRAVTVPDNKEPARAWASVVHGAVTEAYRRVDTPEGPGWISKAPMTGGVAVCLDFILPRRKSAPKGHTPWHTRKPDPDKLVRLVRDALTGIVYVDDAQVVMGTETKREAEIGETPGVRIRVAELDPRAVS